MQNKSSREKIFLIEDNPLLRENVTMLLSLNGFEVLAFDSGASALEKFQEECPDLVLCDIILPGMDGYGILDRVRQMESGSQVPFIFLSALAERDQMRTGMNLGADDYVTKPFKSEDLLAAIEARLKHSKKRADVNALEHQRAQARDLKYLPHEIRTPLNGILGAIQILLLDRETFGSDAGDLMDIIEESADRLEKTVLNYILFLSLSAGRDVFEPNLPVETGQLVASVATNVAREAGRESDLVLHTVEAIRNCKSCLDRVVAETVSNAFKFSRPGSKVEVKMSRNGGRLILSCLDEGCGMTEEEIAGIGPFKQFQREKREQQGLGLGLAICQAQIQCEGCHLTFKTAESGGLAVELSLPDPGDPP